MDELTATVMLFQLQAAGLVSELTFQNFHLRVGFFIQKFKQLWQAGHIAHLDVDANAGEAWVGLRVQLGQPPGHPEHLLASPTFYKSKNTP